MLIFRGVKSTLCRNLLFQSSFFNLQIFDLRLQTWNFRREAMVEALSVKTTTWAVSGLVQWRSIHRDRREIPSSNNISKTKFKTKHHHDINECFCLDLWFSRQVFINTLPPEIMAGETNHLRVAWCHFRCLQKRWGTNVFSNSQHGLRKWREKCGASERMWQQLPFMPFTGGGGKRLQFLLEVCWNVPSRCLQTGGKHRTEEWTTLCRHVPMFVGKGSMQWFHPPIPKCAKTWPEVQMFHGETVRRTVTVHIS